MKHRGYQASDGIIKQMYATSIKSRQVCPVAVNRSTWHFFHMAYFLLPYLSCWFLLFGSHLGFLVFFSIWLSTLLQHNNCLWIYHTATFPLHYFWGHQQIARTDCNVPESGVGMVCEVHGARIHECAMENISRWA